MRELTEDRFYKLIAEYPGCVLDFFLLKEGLPHDGEASHRKAVLFATD